jgi:flagellar basal-body rod protein FlgG
MKPFIQKMIFLSIFALLLSCGGDNSGRTVTGRELDLLAEDATYLVLIGPEGGNLYTRSSSFVVNGDGIVTTKDGMVLSPGILLSSFAQSVKIDPDGTVNVYFSHNSVPSVAGFLTAARFAVPDKLERISNDLYRETAASGAPMLGSFSECGYGVVLQGYLE